MHSSEDQIAKELFPESPERLKRGGRKATGGARGARASRSSFRLGGRGVVFFFLLCLLAIVVTVNLDRGWLELTREDIWEFFGDKPMQQRDQTKFSHGAFYFDGQYLFGCVGAFPLAALIGGVCGVFTCYFMFYDSDIPGSFPPTPISPHKDNQRSSPASRWHLGYIFAPVNALVVFSLALFYLRGGCISNMLVFSNALYTYTKQAEQGPSLRLHSGGLPPKIVRGEGQYFSDERGTRYLDMFNNGSHVGHCHKKVVEAGTKQMAILNTNSRFLNDRIVTFAKHLCATLPEKLNRCFFTNTGSEANDLALQIARRVSGHSQIVSLEGAYHGLLASVNALGSHKSAGGSGTSGKADHSDVCVAPLPDSYRGKYRDPETAGQLYAGEVKAIIEEEQSEGRKVAGFIHETVLCHAGQVVLPNGFLRAVYDYVHAAGGLCIADEAQTGFGRMGKHFWAFEMHGVTPDIVTLGKSMGNGHPVAAVITTKEIAEKFSECGVSYFNTFGGNPVSMAIAEAVLSVVEEEGLQQHAEELGSVLVRGLEGLMEKHLCIGDIRGAGLLLGVDFVKDRETREPDKELADNVVQRLLLDHHIIALADGIHGNVIGIKPPMCVSLKDCQDLLRALDSILTKLAR